MIDRHWARAAAIAVGGSVAVVGTFLPWLRSGSVDRSSYEIFDLVDRLGFAPDGPVGWMIRLWPVVPLLFAVAGAVQFTMSLAPVWVWTRRLAPIVAAVYAGGVAAVLRVAPDAGLVRFRYGTAVTAAGAVIVLLAAAWPDHRRRRAGRRAGRRAARRVSRRGSAASEAS